MRLATFTASGRTRIGVIEQEEIVDLSCEAGLPTDMIALLEGGTPALTAVRSAVRTARRLPLSMVRLEAPVLRPRKFLGLGGSYESHLKEMAHLMQRPRHQTWFNKQVTCVNGPYDDIHMPKVSDTLDYEGELAIVIGTRCRHVSGPAVREVIAGFTICNDVSVREWQVRAPTATLGKSFDTHGPLGPLIVTTDELSNVHSLSLKTRVNGDLRQDGNTSELIYRFRAMIEELSAVFTLEPGDILTTGSPAGVGAARQPPVYLRVGDVVRVEIEGIGHIENRVVPEP
ncbi:MAG: 5-carboxymethyl-2-hydroxymuconate isomerase [Gammaproteobacteria bacterium]|nr:5-carboxymethyl-2-hydroxymuconate isomerase [Gammaproteobacteria bacterium]